MRRIIFSIPIIGFIGIGISGVTVRADSLNNEAGILDGMAFVGHVDPKGSTANGEDEVVFQDGQFLSTSCSKYGFGSAPYTASRADKQSPKI